MPIVSIPIAWTVAVLLGFYQSRVYRTRQEIQDANGDVYLIRYFLWKPKDKNRGRVYLHNIVRGDYDRALHSHPWNFWSVMLWGSYREWADARQIPLYNDQAWEHPAHVEWPLVYRDFSAPCLLRRGAGWRHRLELRNGKVWTLVFTSKKVREWGFFTDLMNNKWCHWTKYNHRTGICEEQ